ncbi:MAG: type II secretion system F family protein [Pseudomonadota bacterium]
MDIGFYGFAILLFAAVILAFEGAWLWWSGTHGDGAQRIARRLRLMSGGREGAGERISILKNRRFAASELAERWLRRLPRADALDRLLLQSGLKWTVARLLQLSLAAPLLALFVLRSLHLAQVFVLAALLAAPCAPYLVLLRARRLRLEKIEEQLPEAADFLARAMRAGHAFANALQMIGEEFPEPISGEFRAAYEEINYGVPMNEALQNLANRIPLTDLRYLVIAVLIQRESGGNLAELLGNISRIIRERLKLIGQIRVLSAEGRMSAWILSVLPFGVAFAMLSVNPAYISQLWREPSGVRLLWCSLGMLIVALIWMRNIIRIRV